MMATTAPLTTHVRAAEQAPAGRWEQIRRRAAYFWVGYLMLGQLERRPWLVRLTRPFFLWFAWNTARVMRRSLMANARRILDASSTPRQQRAHCRRVLQNFYDFICDLGRAPAMSDAQLQARIATVHGRERYDQVRQLGRGAIIVTAHLGSYELGMVCLRQIEPRVHVVFRRDPMNRFERLRSRLHERLGIEEAAVDGGLAAWMHLRSALADNAVVLMQADRVMPDQKGERVGFLGGHLRVPGGPVKLSLATGAPIVPIFSVRQDDGRVAVHIEEAIFPQTMTDAPMAPHPALLGIAEVMARYVRQYPDQWLRLQTAFCEDMDDDPAIEAEGAP